MKPQRPLDLPKRKTKERLEVAPVYASMLANTPIAVSIYMFLKAGVTVRIDGDLLAIGINAIQEAA